MGRAPYKSNKEGVGALLNVSTFNNERASMPCLQQLNASRQITRQIIMYNGTTNDFEVES